MKKATLAASLVLTVSCLPTQAVAGEVEREVEQEIWDLEEAYLTHHRNADHEQILPMWHERFLGWPDLEPQPVDKEAAARRLGRKYAEPASWTFTIERAGIRVAGNVAVNYYTLHFLRKDDTGRERKETRRIMHTWIREGSQWKILGGMSKQQ
jgi:ketosteroid isomerase-like protein